ncbi:MAG: PilN domain-containing protein, partial [Candidatus Rokuibacteriota bacterium]
AKERAELDLRLSVIDQLSHMRFNAVRLVDELDRAVPEYLWLTGALMTGPTSMNIEGVTFSNLIVADYMTRLERSPYFANVNMTIAESIAKLRAVMQVAERGRVHVGCGISTSFGCPFEGEVPLPQLESVVRRLVDLGARAIGLADTTGMANPRQVAGTLEHLMPRFPGVEWTLHTHDTRAMAIPNILAALEGGVTNFDASIGGLGGCPFAPGASGNVCSEDFVHCMHAMGVETGIDLDRLIATSRRVEEIVGRVLPGQVVKAGTWDRRYPVPDAVAARLTRAG